MRRRKEEGTGGAAAPLAPILTAIGGLYIVQSVAMGVILTSLPAIMRVSGLPLDQIGLVSLALLPWILKCLWSGAIERYRLPPDGRPRTTLIVAVGIVLSAAALAASAPIGPTSFTLLLGCLLIAAFATATVDIACDGFAVETLSERHRGWGNAAQIGGSYIGLSMGGALFLYLTAEASWGTAAWTAAGLILALGVPFLLIAPRFGHPSHRAHRPRLAAAFRSPRIRTGLLLVMVFGAGQRLGHSMLSPFLIDAGLTLKQVGAINGLGVAGIGFIGTIVGGAAVRRFGSTRCTRLAIGAQTACLAVLILSAASGLQALEALTAMTFVASASASFGFVALYAELMGYASRDQAGIDFTLFQCADAAMALAAGTAGGMLAGHLGYAACFALSCCTSLAATVAVLRLTRGIPADTLP